MTNNFKPLGNTFDPGDDEKNKQKLLSAEVVSDVEKTLALDRARLQLDTRTQGGMRCYLVSLELPENEPSRIQEGLQELGSLVRSLGDEPIGATVQKRSKPDPSTFIGTGKAEELKLIGKSQATSIKFDYVVFDQELSPSQVRNLEKVLELPVLDRTAVILQIFRKNAKTREAKTQVEIAHLEFLAPRLSNAWIAFERQRGGSGGGGTRVRGAGETQLELDRRRVREKISNLRRELVKIQRERETQRKSRSDELMVALVGYTNAGKTTIMNGLTESDLSAKDALFETLDSTVRQLKGTGPTKVLITDTVGFIRNLPHGLVASFRSTLEETTRADLLLHVVDVSNPRYKDHMAVTDEVLKEVGAGDVPRLIVFNKFDQLKGEPRLQKILARSYPGCVCISASADADIKKLKESVLNFVQKDMVERDFKVAYNDSTTMAQIYAHTKIISTTWQDDVAHFRVRMSKESEEKYFKPAEKKPESTEDLDLWRTDGFNLE